MRSKTDRPKHSPEKFDFVAPASLVGKVSAAAMENSPPPSHPPACVALVARTHWVVAGVIVVSLALLRGITIKFPIEFTARTYLITGGLAALYGLAGTLVWFGTFGGRLLSRICG